MTLDPPLRFAQRLAVSCLISVAACAPIASSEPAAESRQAADRETVVLLHGLGRSQGAMWLLASRIERAGFNVVRIGYRSLSDPPEVILASIGRQIDACCKDSPRPVHFVGHSLGGLFIRAYLAENRLQTPGRVVLIATPNGGTPLVDAFRNSWLLALAGPTARKLGTDVDSFPNSLPAPDYPVGVIAGVVKRPLVDLIPGEDDGLVPLASAKITGMADLAIVKSNHAWLRYSQEAARQTIAFLRNGAFAHDELRLASRPRVGWTGDDLAAQGGMTVMPRSRVEPGTPASPRTSRMTISSI